EPPNAASHRPYALSSPSPPRTPRRSHSGWFAGQYRTAARWTQTPIARRPRTFGNPPPPRVGGEGITAAGNDRKPRRFMLMSDGLAVSFARSGIWRKYP